MTNLKSKYCLINHLADKCGDCPQKFACFIFRACISCWCVAVIRTWHYPGKSPHFVPPLVHCYAMCFLL